MAPSLRRSLPCAAALALAASTGHADESVNGSAETATGYHEHARTPGQRDLDHVSTVGLGAAGGLVLTGGGGALLGVLDLDAELAIGRHLKLFASVPMVLGRGDEREYRGNGLGNLTGGALLVGDVPGVTAGVGASLSGAGSEDGQWGILLRHDLPQYETDATVWRGYGDLRADLGDGYLQLQVDYTYWKLPAGSIDTIGNSWLAGRLGGAVPTSENGKSSRFVGDLGVEHALGAGGVPGGSLAVIDAGVRWRLGAGSPMTCSTTISYMHGTNVDALGLGVELLADFMALGVTR